MIHLHTLGDALIRVGDREIRPTSPMVFAALLYLGLERGQRVPRSALQELLFPDADERSGAHSLRQLLYKLRQLGAPIDADAGSVSVRREDVHHDAAAEVAVATGNLGGLERYAHGLLPDYAPAVSPEYDAWLEQKRETMLADIRRGLVAAMCSSREAVNWQAVERLAHVILELDPFNEEATLALAEATAMAGAKTRALGILSRYEAETGRRDLRLAPAVLRRRISESLPSVARRRPTPFVGREADSEVLRHQVVRARGGKASLAVVVGEAGIGKTRLVEEAASLAALDGMRVHVVRCQAHYASRPLGVFIELVPALLTSRGALGVSPQSLAHLQLLVSHRDDDRDRPVDARDDMTRSAILRTALRDLADAVASEAPLLIVVEDAHHADPDSLRELSGLTQTAAERALLVVFTARYLEPLQHGTVLHEHAVVRRLKPLGQQPMEDLARHLVPAAGPAGDVGAWCVRTAAGNPLFLEMLCARYVETGEPYSVPPSLVSAITRRIELLPPECTQVLEYCALLGRHATIEALRALTAAAPRELLKAVRRLEEEGYLQNRDDAVRISHDLLTECTLNLIPPVTRKVLHGCVAANLEQRFETTNDAALLWDCAEQWTSSGESEKAIRLLRRCARHASAIGKAGQALELLQRAREIAKYPHHLRDVLGDMMLASKTSAQWTNVLELSSELAQLNLGLPRESHSELELVSIEACWLTRFEAGGDLTRLLQCARSSDADTCHRVDAACLLLKIAHEKGDANLATAAFESVEQLLGSRSLRYADRIVPIVYHASFGDRDRAVALSRSLVSDLRSMESIAAELRAALNLCVLFILVGELTDALNLAQSYIQRAKSLDLDAWEYDFNCASCVVCLMQEDFDAAQQWCDLATALKTNGHRGGLSHAYAANALELALWKADVTSAQRELERAEQSLGESLRFRAYLQGVELRMRQLDPTYQCEDAKLQDLIRVHEATKRLTGGDGLAVELERR